MKYGHRIVREGYHNGELTSKIIHEEESIEIKSNEHLLNEVLSGLDLVINSSSNEVTLIVKRNKEGKLRLTKCQRID